MPLKPLKPLKIGSTLLCMMNGSSKFWWLGDVWSNCVESSQTQTIIKEDKNLEELKFYYILPLSFLFFKCYIIFYL